MMLRPHSVGLALGLFLGALHAVWGILVWSGTAQTIIDFIFGLHMIRPPYVVTAFNAGTAIALVLVTTVIGYASGWFIAFLWNRIGARR